MPDYKTNLISEFNENEFDTLWEEGKHTVLHNFPFHLWPQLRTENQKRDHFKNLYLHFLSAGILWKSTLDGKTVALNGGRIIDDPKKGRLIEWNVALLGYQPDGTRAWLVADWATAERDRFWAEIGVNGWRQKIVDLDGTNGIARHYKNNKNVEESKGNKIEMTDPKADEAFINRMDIDITKEN